MSSIIAISYEDVQPVTPSDTAKVPGNMCAGFIVGVAGNVVITTALGTKTAIPALAGLVYSIPCSQIWNTSTTASTISAVYANPYKARTST